jgi:hypothetical protein
MHDHASLVAYGLGFWSLRGLLSSPPRRLPPLLIGGMLPPPSKGPPPILLIGITCPLVGGLQASPIGDGLPFHSLYDFSVKTIHFLK